MHVDPIRVLGAMIDVLRLTLVAAAGVAILASTWIASRAVSQRLERRYLPGIERWSGRRAGLSEDAGPWACPSCHSVNVATAESCYRCTTIRAEISLELARAAAADALFRRPEPEGRFDPSLYRGPGAAPPDAGGRAP